MLVIYKSILNIYAKIICFADNTIILVQEKNVESQNKTNQVFKRINCGWMVIF